MRRFLFLALAVLLVFGFVLLSAGTALARSGPFRPGDTLFPLQFFAEQQQVRWPAGRPAHAVGLLDLYERRLSDLVVRTGSPHETATLSYLDTALNQAIVALTDLPPDVGQPLGERLLSLIGLTQVALGRLTVAPVQDPGRLDDFSAKLTVLRQLAQDPGFDMRLLASVLETDSGLKSTAQALERAPAGDDFALANPQGVPFPPGSPARQHKFYPLEGAHSTLECATCHADQVYSGTPNWCQACHADSRPAVHYEGDCSTCHTPTSWADATFDHTLAGGYECLYCHQEDRPANHFGGQCVACHNTTAWLPASFDHAVAGAKDCQSCHRGDKPANHFEGQCSACHTTQTWKGAKFDHRGQANCQSCHSADRPANHFSGQCSSCHTNQQWLPATFNHNGSADCKACHAGDRPAGHFSGQCSQCHNTRDWDDAEFNHDSQADCKACHAGDRPKEHSSNQCSQCHNTRNWDDADDDNGGAGGGDDDDD